MTSAWPAKLADAAEEGCPLVAPAAVLMGSNEEGTMRLQAHYIFTTLPRPTYRAIKAWERRLSLLDWARVCRMRSLITAAPWDLADADGLMLGYLWPLHELRHGLRRPDPLEWFMAVVALERTRDVCCISHPTDGGTWDLGEHVVTLHGALRLLARFGVGRPWWEEAWPCEDCLCRLCHAPVSYPSTTCHNGSPCAVHIHSSTWKI